VGHAALRARLEAAAMFGLIVKCAVLVVMIHIFRALGRLAGPRYSGLALGLPSTTAVVLIFCGYEQGSLAATQMAESGLLGLVATVSLPLAFIGSVRLGWRLWGAIATSVGGYVAVAAGLGCLPATGVLPKVSLAAAALVGAAMWVRDREVSTPEDKKSTVRISPLRTMFLRTATPALYIFVLAIAQQLAGPSLVGLVSTFPSLSLVVLIVTYLESGPAEAGRIAQVLPSGNTSTLAFLAVFQLVCSEAGIAWGTFAGYAAALGVLVAVQAVSNGTTLVSSGGPSAQPIRRLGRIIWTCSAERLPWPRGMHWRRPGAFVRRASRDRVRRRPTHRCGFAPLVETLVW
jgi:hypothetical protein